MSATKFSVRNIPELVSKLTPVQKRLLDSAWNHYLATDKPYPLRSFPSVIGKQLIEEVFNGLNGSLIYEVWDQGGRSYKLTCYGALLTGYGNVLAALLVRLLECVRTLYEQDTSIRQIGSMQLKDGLKLSEHETQLLLKLLGLQMPFNLAIQLGGLSGDGRSWTLLIGDEVVDLYRADALAHLDACLSAGYKPDQPVLRDQRLREMLINETARGSELINNTVTERPPASLISRPYVSSDRLAELKKIKNVSADCTRLICMCEELNECAARGNAHAVIMLLRAVLDHVPPVFGYETFEELASNYGGGKSFKRSAERLEKQSRNVADRLLHTPIRPQEVAPDMHEVSFEPELETVLSEFCRLLKKPT